MHLMKAHKNTNKDINRKTSYMSIEILKSIIISLFLTRLIQENWHHNG